MKLNYAISRRTFLEQVTPAAIGLAAGTGALSSYAAGHHTPAEKKFVPVMITPLRSDLKIDYDKLPMLIDFYLAAGAKGFFANCLSSETFFMNDAERIELTRHVVQYIGKKVSVVSTGSFGDTMGNKVAFAKRIEDTGASGVILISSHFAAASESDEVLIQNFQKFLSLTGDMKVGTYECPLPYKRLISPAVFQSLVSNRRFIYHKDTSEDIQNMEVKLKIAHGTQLEFYNAHTASAAESLRKGGQGMSPISGNFYPEIQTWLCRYANDPSKSADVDWIQSEIARTEPLISKYYPLSSKYFLKKRGLPIELVCRSKAKSIPAEQMKVLDDIYRVFLGWCDRLGIQAVNARR